MTVSSDLSFPHRLDLVIDFVNTRDLDEGTDELTDPAALGRWLTERGLLQPGRGTAASPTELREAIELREALRAALALHNGEPGDGGAGARVLERVGERGRLAVGFQEDGTVALDARGEGVAGALARLLVLIAEASADGTWQRVKACAADDCRWAFYDRSRNRSGRWCDMAVCGNRTKVRAYRQKRDD